MMTKKIELISDKNMKSLFETVKETECERMKERKLGKR